MLELDFPPQAAASLQATLAKVVAALQPDHVLSASSGCIESLRRACGTTPVHELTDFLDRSPGWEGLTLRDSRLRVGLHVPCTQRNVVRRADSARALLARIPGIDLVPAPETGCCGAAGSYFIEHPAIADALRDEKLDQAATFAPDLLLTTNIGCRIHLGNGTRERDGHLRVLHPLALLAQQLDNPAP